MRHTLVPMLVIFLIAAGITALSQDAPKPAPEPPVKVEAAPPLLSPAEADGLNKAASVAEAATAKRKELQSPYQEALNAELNALLFYSNSIRFVERGKCGRNEALAKPQKEWVCVQLNPQVPPATQ